MPSSPLLRKQGLDAFLQQLNDPETAIHDPRSDKEFEHPYGSKGTEPETVKQGGRLLQHLFNDPSLELPPSMKTKPKDGCPTCGGLTRRMRPNGTVEDICTKCMYHKEAVAIRKFCGQKEETLQKV